MCLGEVFRERREPEPVATPRDRTHRLVLARSGLTRVDVCRVARRTLVSDFTAENIPNQTQNPNYKFPDCENCNMIHSICTISAARHGFR